MSPASTEAPELLYARVTAIDSFAKWRRGTGFDKKLSSEEFVEKVASREREEKRQLTIGKALHKALEFGQAGEFDTLEADGFTFHFAAGCEVQLAPIRELRVEHQYGELIVSGQVDGLEGKRVDDHKSTSAPFNAASYTEGWQWRFYLDIFEADRFRWNVFPIRPFLDAEGQPVPNHFHVDSVETFEACRYPGMAEECAQLAAEYADFLRDFVIPEKARLAIEGPRPKPEKPKRGKKAKAADCSTGNNLAVLPVLDASDPAAIFSKDRIEALVAQARAAVIHDVPDLSTDKGRKAIASAAYKVAQFKVAIDDLGKGLVAEWKQRSAAVDALRKLARDQLDALKEEVRAPLDAWEEEQKRIAQEKAEAERREREEREAEEQRQRDEEARIAREKQEALDAKERELREREERLAAKEREAEEAEARKAREAKIAEDAAAAAVAAERRRSEQAEEDRRREEQRQADEKKRREDEELLAEQERLSDMEHRRSVNGGALKALIAEGLAVEDAKKAIVAIAAGRVPAVRINY
jgi:colicin import membrane protein